MSRGQSNAIGLQVQLPEISSIDCAASKDYIGEQFSYHVDWFINHDSNNIENPIKNDIKNHIKDIQGKWR